MNFFFTSSMQKRNSVEANMKNCRSFHFLMMINETRGQKLCSQSAGILCSKPGCILSSLKDTMATVTKNKHAHMDFQVLVKIVQNRTPPLPKPFLAPLPRPSLHFLMIHSLGDSRGGCLCGMCSFSRALQEALNKHAASM